MHWEKSIWFVMKAFEYGWFEGRKTGEVGDAVTRKECWEAGPVRVAGGVGVAEASAVLREESGMTSRFQI